jgi:hypothetical protein
LTTLYTREKVHGTHEVGCVHTRGGCGEINSYSDPGYVQEVNKVQAKIIVQIERGFLLPSLISYGPRRYLKMSGYDYPKSFEYADL